MGLGRAGPRPRPGSRCRLGGLGDERLMPEIGGVRVSRDGRSGRSGRTEPGRVPGGRGAVEQGNG